MDKDTSPIADIPVERIIRMRIPALQRIHRLLFGKDSTVTHTLYLRRKLAWELQARTEGGLSEESRQHALAIAWQTTLRTRAHSQPSRPVNSTVSLGHDTRLPPPGTLLRRRFKGQSVLVKVLAAGFEYDGRIFGSLSPIANEVTGGNWNGRQGAEGVSGSGTRDGVEAAFGGEGPVTYFNPEGRPQQIIL